MTLTSPQDDAVGFQHLPDLALRSVGGSVLWANDEFFAEREALIRPGPAQHRPRRSVPRGRYTTGGRHVAAEIRDTTAQ